MRNLLLLVQILIVALVALLLSDPQIKVRGSETRGDLLLIIDTTASMGADAGGMTRLDMAKRDAKAILPKNSLVMIAAAHARTDLLELTPVAAGRASRLIDELEPTAATGSFTDSILDALRLTADFAPKRIVAFSDGIPTDDRFAGLPANVDIRDVSISVDNSGITLFTFRRPVNLASEYEMLLRVHTFGETRHKIPAVIAVDESVVWTGSISPEPGSYQTIAVPYDGPVPHKAEARIDIDDALEADDSAWAVFGRGSRSITLVSSGGFFVEHALDSHPNIELTVTDRYDAKESQDIVVFERVNPPLEKPPRFLLIGANLPGTGGSFGPLQNPRVTGWQSAHPIVTGIDPADLSIFRSVVVRRDKVDSIVHSGEYSLFWTVEDEKSRGVGISFEIENSDLPLRADFPILMANIIAWLDDGRDFEVLQIESGRPIAGISDSLPVAVVRPDGSRIEIETASDGRYYYLGTDRPGLYRIESAEESYSVAINVASVRESDLTPKSPLTARDVLTGEARPASTGGSAGNIFTAGRRSIWLFITLLVATIVFAEWLLWNKRETA